MDLGNRTAGSYTRNERAQADGQVVLFRRPRRNLGVYKHFDMAMSKNYRKKYRDIRYLKHTISNELGTSIFRIDIAIDQNNDINRL